MSNIRPGDATHTDRTEQFYKPDMFSGGWMRWDVFARKWQYAGPVPEDCLTPLPSVEVVELEKFDARLAPSPFEVPLPREQYSGIPVPSMESLPSTLPDKSVHDLAQAYAKLVTSLDSDAPYTAHFVEYRFVGSRITCNPPPLDTDQDVLALSYSCDVVERKMLAAGFTKEGSNPADLGGSIDKESVFHSYRKGDMNYVVTGDRDFYERFSTATELARKYNLMAKADRIQLFQAVLYGKWWA